MEVFLKSAENEPPLPEHEDARRPVTLSLVPTLGLGNVRATILVKWDAQGGGDSSVN